MDKKLLEQLVFKYHPSNLPKGTLKKNETLNQDNIVKRKSIKVLTYNLYMRPPPVKTNESDHKDARLIEFAK